ncbi:MAG: hypothetical protein QOK29_220 [Rhodospirillaceae bacterium]|nr:hypothetical protein [Rhodospirillaceae bacterium]
MLRTEPMNSTHRTTVTIPVAERWFELRRLADDITFLTEPHVVPLLRCNIWHVSR